MHDDEKVNDFRINYCELPFTKGPYSYEFIVARPNGKWRIRDSDDNACGSAENEESAKAAVHQLNKQKI